MNLARATINHYLAHKQHLSPAARQPDLAQTTRDLVGLHASTAIGPYLSLWARTPDFRREMLDEVLFEARTLAKILCMRYSVFAVLSNEIPLFTQAYADRPPSRDQASLNALLTLAGLCSEADADAFGADLRRQVLLALHARGTATLVELSADVPPLATKIRHSEGKDYEGTFSLGSRLLPLMCAEGAVIRARLQGSWRSTQYAYATLADWLPELGPTSVSPETARTWLIRRYLAAYGPVTPDDVKWWTGLPKIHVKQALERLAPASAKVTIEDRTGDYLMLAEDFELLNAFTPPAETYAALLPSLDPFIMGYRDRSLFLDHAHNKKVFDPTGNAAPTVWIDGRVVGLWGQRKDGTITHHLFAPVDPEGKLRIEEEIEKLALFLDGEAIPSPISTPFSRRLT